MNWGVVLVCRFGGWSEGIESFGRGAASCRCATPEQVPVPPMMSVSGGFDWYLWRTIYRIIKPRIRAVSTAPSRGGSAVLATPDTTFVRL